MWRSDFATRASCSSSPSGARWTRTSSRGASSPRPSISCRSSAPTRNWLVVETPEAERARAGLERYAAARAGELTREIHSEFKRALWALVPTGAIFALTVVLSRLADGSSSHWFSTTISEALVVIGWVVLWAPIAILGTDIWMVLGRRRAYRKLADVEVRQA